MTSQARRTLRSASGAGSNLTTGNYNIDIGAGVTGTSGDTGAIGLAETSRHRRSSPVNAARSPGPPARHALDNSSGAAEDGHERSGLASLGGRRDLLERRPADQLKRRPRDVTASRRFKTDIQPLGRASEHRLMALRPISFHYKRRYIRANRTRSSTRLQSQSRWQRSTRAWLPTARTAGPTVRYQELRRSSWRNCSASMRRFARQAYRNVAGRAESYPAGAASLQGTQIRAQRARLRSRANRSHRFGAPCGGLSHRG